MKKHLLIPFLAFMFLAIGNVSAQDKGKDDAKSEESYLCDGHYHGDYHCWRAWKKERKIHKKMAQAEEMDCYRPWAAERKMLAAYRKAWKRDSWENDHRDGYAHGWGWGWRWRRDYWY